MRNEGRVHFELSGNDFDPENLPIGIEPTKTARKGSLAHRRCFWIFSGEKVEASIIDIREMSARVVGELEPYAAAIREAVSRHDLTPVLKVVLTVAPESTAAIPQIGFTPEVVSFLGEVGASIDVDLYRGDS